MKLRWIYLFAFLVSCGQGQLPSPGTAPLSTKAALPSTKAVTIESFQHHPITHDQLFVSHPNVVNGDYIGFVHYLCTDSIFNNRSSGTYSWSIVSGNEGSAFAVNSNTGLLTVNNHTEVDQDFILGVKITHGSDADTAHCTIKYRSGKEGKRLIYVDPDHTGRDAGTFANPYQDLTPIDDYGDFDDGMTVLLRRGTILYPNEWLIDNQGDRIILAAYGTGTKPILHETFDKEQMIKLGKYGGADDKADCDSFTIMDIEFNGDGVKHQYAIYNEEYSDHNEFHRIYCDKINSGNGAFDFWGESDADAKIWDCGFNDIDRTIGNRAIKGESWGITIENVWCTDMSHSAIMCGLWGESFGTMKYLYLQNSNSVWTDGAIQIRDYDINIEWMYTKDYHYGISWENYDYGDAYGDLPHPWLTTVKNLIVEGATVGLVFKNFAPGTLNIFDSITIENALIKDPADEGIYLHSLTNTMDFDHLLFNKLLIINSATEAIDIGADEQNELTFQNCIFYGSGSTDVLTSGPINGSVFRNNIYQTITDASHWKTFMTNYDYDSGNPFKDKANGDYSSGSEATSVIDSGTDAGQDKDILSNDITTQDIGPFEYGGTKYNWANRK